MILADRQEMLHRYVTIDRRETLEDGFTMLDDRVGTVLPIQRGDVDAAREIAMRQPLRSALDCLHVAVMRDCGVDRILTFDTGFSTLAGVTRPP